MSVNGNDPLRFHVHGDEDGRCRGETDDRARAGRLLQQASIRLGRDDLYLVQLRTPPIGCPHRLGREV